MSCSPFDLRDYFLRELPDPERRQVEGHIRGCTACSQELDRLRLTQAALFSLRDEEVPQRIAFLSDKIFEPAAWRRAWAAFWGSSARLAFASAAMLSIALVVFALARPAASPQGRPAVALNTPPATVSPADLQKQIQAAVAQAVAVSEAREEKKLEQQVAQMRQLVAWAEADRDFSRRREMVMMRSSYEQPQVDNGAQK